MSGTNVIITTRNNINIAVKWYFGKTNVWLDNIQYVTLFMWCPTLQRLIYESVVNQGVAGCIIKYAGCFLVAHKDLLLHFNPSPRLPGTHS